MESIKEALSSESARNNSSNHIPLLSLNLPSQSQTFKERSSLSERIAAVENIRMKFPQKVPVIVEKYKKVSAIRVTQIKVLLSCKNVINRLDNL